MPKLIRKILPSKQCLYCENRKSNKSDEHIIPEAIGGTKCIPDVCKNCNTRILSVLDDELCTRSPLAWLANKHFKDAPNYFMWLIHGKSEILLEGTFDHSRGLPFTYPQLIFINDRLELRGDAEEIQAFGTRQFNNLIIDAARRSFQKSENGHKTSLIKEPIKPAMWPSTHKFPPRIFSRSKISEIKRDSTLILRYLNKGDMRHALNLLSKLKERKTFRYSRTEVGPQKAVMQLIFSPEIVGRALLKISINLLRFVCENTIINRSTFPFPIGLVTGPKRDRSYFQKHCGFAAAESLRQMECPDGYHKAWLVYETNGWTMQLAFFGGAAGVIARFPGPTNESWRWAEVTIPIKSSDWITNKSNLVPPLCGKLAENSMSEILPSMLLNDPKEGLSSQQIRAKKYGY